MKKLMAKITNLDQKISKYFTWRDLTKTEQGTANIPNDAAQVQIKKLAALLDRIRDDLGPMTVISAFRSEETQAKLKAAGEPAAAKSFHELGMAADIVSGSDDLYTYWLKIVKLPWAKSGLGEIILKTPQNAVHLSLPAPPRTVFKLMEQDVAKNYKAVSAERLAQIERNYGRTAGSIVASLPQGVKRPTTWLMAGGVVAALAALFLFMRRREPVSAKPNPYMTESAFRREHERLLKVLARCRSPEARREYEEQLRELTDYNRGRK